MTPEKIIELGARRFGHVDYSSDSIQCIKGIFPLPPVLMELVASFEGAIIFANGAIYKPVEECALVDSRGCLDLLTLLSLGSGPKSILTFWAQRKEELGDAYLPIGEASGGNIICIDRDFRVFYWNHEGGVGESLFLISESLDSFFRVLKPDESELEDVDGIVESESYLDF